MNSIFKILLSLLILIGQFEFSYAQSASILPPAKTTFVDKNGKPLTSGTVDFYIPGTTTRKMTWQDAGQTIPNANPVVLDSAGRAIIFGDGSYRQVLKDRYNNIIWDGYTSSAGSGGTTATVGDGDAVGTVKAWSGFTAPYGYTFAYGQELVRASYTEAFDVLTSEQNVSCTSGSPTLTGVSSTTQLPIGAPIESSCLNAGATIISKTVSTVTASSNAIISTTTTATFFPFGNGDGSLTFNIPDLRGRVVAGNDAMGGIAANRLTSTYFGLDADALGSNGGSQNQSIAQTNLPAISPTFTGANATINSNSTTSNFAVADSVQGINATAGSTVVALTSIGSGLSGVASTGSYTPSGTISALGSGNPIATIQPTQTQNYIIKIIPDSNPNSFFGVASIGGMYGVIECGFGLTCAGNTISIAGSTVSGVSSINGNSGAFTTSSGVKTVTNNIQIDYSANNTWIGNNAINAQFSIQGNTYYPVCDTTGITDCTSNIQSIVTLLSSNKGGIIQLPCGLIQINHLSFTVGGIWLKGCGYEDFLGAQGSTTPVERGTAGTYIITKVNTYNTIELTCGANNVHISDISFEQVQPADIVGWTPTIYPPTIGNLGCQTANSGMGSFIAERLMFRGVSTAIQFGMVVSGPPDTNSFIGRATLRDIWATCFQTCFSMVAASDIILADHIHVWPLFYADGSSPNIFSYIQNNAVGFLTGRIDNAQFSNIFINNASTGFRFLNLVGTAGNVIANCQMSNIGLDAVKVGISIEASGMNCHAVNVYHQSPGSAPFEATYYGIQVLSFVTNATFTATNVKFINYQFQAVLEQGSSNDLSFNNLWCDNWNVSNTPGTGCLFVDTGNTVTVTGRYKTTGGNGGPITYGSGTANTLHIN